ncbi:MAG: dihydropyrimidinase [Anaerolineales bacterium]|jgi:dihydropyrimidinase|nr:dihydropyrimidinase [Anaerolineales bacterium]HJO33900.1 dihydropyrimidinase [Anaerolineales bacterium]
MNLLFRNANIITHSETRRCDLLVEGEIIAAIGQELPAADAEVVDCSGLNLLPGGVEPHAHLALPMFGTVSSDDHYSGHRAAAFGGTTTVLDFTAQSRGGSLQESIEAWHAKAQRLAAVDYSFHVNVTDFNPSVAAEISRLPAQGLTSLKVFTAYNGRLRIADEEILQVLRIARENGMLVLLHAEDGDEIETLVSNALAAGHEEPIWHARTRPARGEVVAGQRAIALASDAEAPLYVVHVTTAGLVERLRRARTRGVPVMGETCPQYLFFTEDHLMRPDGAKWVCSPPLRTAADNAALWQALADGSIQTVGTDHCPFFFDGTTPIDYEGRPVAIAGKELGQSDFTLIPNGLPGIEHRLPLLWTFGVGAGRFSAERFVELTAANPAKTLGLYPRKGALLPGSDADIALWDPAKQHALSVRSAHMRTDYDLWEGVELTGFPEKIYLRGRLLVDGERWLGGAGGGQFLRRRAGVPVL